MQQELGFWPFDLFVDGVSLSSNSTICRRFRSPEPTADEAAFVSNLGGGKCRIIELASARNVCSTFSPSLALVSLSVIQPKPSMDGMGSLTASLSTIIKIKIKQ